MSIQTAAQELIETLNGNRRYHNSTLAELSVIFNGRLNEEQKLMQESLGKPCGLWYAFDGSWLDWCLSESPGWIRPYVYEVIVDESKTLRITTLEEFAAFEEEYYYVPPRFRNIEEQFNKEYKLSPILHNSGYFDNRSMFGSIDWLRVAERYGAVEINPYQWERRLNSRWYYGWDCASGCVWSTAYKGVRLVAAYDETKDKFIKVL
jgi:hypothetical protein